LRDGVSKMRLFVTASLVCSRCDDVHTSGIYMSPTPRLSTAVRPLAPAVKKYQLQEAEYSTVTFSAQCNCATGMISCLLLLLQTCISVHCMGSACLYTRVMHARSVKKGKVFPYSLPSVGPGADPGVQAVSPQVT